MMEIISTDTPVHARVDVQPVTGCHQVVHRRWSCRARTALSATLTLALITAFAYLGTRQLRVGFHAHVVTTLQVKEEEADLCSFEHDVDYLTERQIKIMKRVGSLELCRRKCLRVRNCGAWTWGEARNVEGVSDVCFLKELKKSQDLSKRRKRGVVSGLRPRADCELEGEEQAETEERREEEAGDEEQEDEQEEEQEDEGRNRRRGRHKGQNKSADGDEEEEEEGETSRTTTTTGPKPAPKPKPGEIQNQHGICLEASEPDGGSTAVRMMDCRQEIGVDVPRQRWVYKGEIGQIKNHEGMCLYADHPHEEHTEVRMKWCSPNDPGQQWAFSLKTGQIVNWHGICLDAPQRHVDDSKVVMRTCDMTLPSQQWFIGVPYTYDRWYYNSPKWEGNYTPGSLFCFALVVTNSTEKELLHLQYKEQIGIFACDEYEVYSNTSIKITKDFTTSVVDYNLECKIGGEFRTALNLAIFMHLWKKVIKDGRFRHHHWTVKADADAVFFPDRLRWVLRAHPEDDDRGVYLNNCKFGMHGPVEVFSRTAVEAWGKGMHRCQNHFNRLCAGDCRWGEDMFVDQCLMRVLRVRRDNEFRLLTEEHCDPIKGWHSCRDASHVSFHPFKEVKAYQRCLKNAVAAETA